MPSIPRAKCESGIYHVMMRGNGRQIIFEDVADREHLIDSLFRFQAFAPVEIHCYCLMENHFHLLLRGDDNQLVSFMRRLSTGYSKYFNARHERVGSLFQHPYKSQPIESDAQYLTTFRYILQNPLKAGVSSVERFPWSSFHDIDENPGCTDGRLAVELAGGVEALRTFVLAKNDDTCMDIVDDAAPDGVSKAVQALKELGLDPGEVKSLPKAARNAALAQLRKRGHSVRSIERATGVSRGIIQGL